MFSRIDRSPVAEWFRTIDGMLLAAILVLLSIGLIASRSASPAVAARLGLDPMHFANKHLLFFFCGVGILFLISFLEPRYIRRICIFVLALALALMAVTLLLGTEVKGARRWIELFGFSVQPSEFVKPAFIVFAAVCLGESSRVPGVPARGFAILFFIVILALLAAQPDFGQVFLVASVFGLLFFVSGLAWPVIISLIGAAIAGGALVYRWQPHVSARIDRYLNPRSGDNYQVERAVESVLSGGWWGRGPGEGTVKRVLPDSHTDFIFAVIAEEFGIAVCLALTGLFLFVVIRGFWLAWNRKDSFVRLATFGLVSLFGLQSVINIGVNLGLLPAKGMTLPFISYGGSSLVSMSFALGMVLALTRQRPEAVPLHSMFPGTAGRARGGAQAARTCPAGIHSAGGLR